MLGSGENCTTNMANSRCRALHGSDGIIDKAGFVDGVLATTLWLPPGPHVKLFWYLMVPVINVMLPDGMSCYR